VPAAGTDVPDVPDLLKHGAIEKIELIPWGSNYTFAAALRSQAGETGLAVYKPRRGEAPLRDFPSGTLYKREVAAYLFARELGWGVVPPTIIREDGPHGIGSLQLYVYTRDDASTHYDNLRRTHADQLRRMALFDLLANNADRKGGHCLLDEQGHVWGIDHGLTFHHVPKLRTIIWDYCGEEIPAPLVAHLEVLRTDPVRVKRIRAILEPLLSSIEVEALFKRWDHLVEYPCYPHLDPYRNVPWPPF
jgi:hypothetical protein